MGAILSNLGNLEPFLNHFGIVFRHLEQLFGIFEVSVLEGPMASKTGQPEGGQSDFFFIGNHFFAHFWVHFLATF